MKTLSAEIFASIKAQIVSVENEPFPELDLDFADLDFDSCNAVPDDMGAHSKPIPARLTGTRRICIRLSAHTLASFKAQAAKTGVPYQTIMNRALKVVAGGW